MTQAAIHIKNITVKKPIGAIQSLIDFEYFRNIMKTPYCIYRLPIPAQFSTPLKLLRGGGGQVRGIEPLATMSNHRCSYLESEH